MKDEGCKPLHFIPHPSSLILPGYLYFAALSLMIWSDLAAASSSPFLMSVLWPSRYAFSAGSKPCPQSAPSRPATGGRNFTASTSFANAATGGETVAKSALSRADLRAGTWPALAHWTEFCDSQPIQHPAAACLAGSSVVIASWCELPQNE